jgi:hypothetical protein
VPSIFPETFGLVAAEFAAAGVVPFVADHSGLREAGALVGQGLPFDLRVPWRVSRRTWPAPSKVSSRCRTGARGPRRYRAAQQRGVFGLGTLAEKIVAVFEGRTADSRAPTAGR